MPFILQDQKNTTNQATPNVSGVTTSFGANLPGQVASKSPQKSGQYQNIQKYLESNQPQAQEMAQKVGGQVESQITQAQQKGQELGQQVQKVQEYNPTEVLKNLPQATEEQKKTYQYTKQTGGYTGPQDITGLKGYGEAQTAAEKAKESYGLLGTEGGQKTLLQQTYNQPKYGGGLLSLDQALLQRSQTGKQELEGLQSKYKGLEDLLKTPVTQATQDIAAAKEQAGKNIAAFSPAEEAAQKEILSPIEQRVAEANLNKPYEAIKSDIQDLYLDPATLEALGLTSGQHIYDTDLSKFLAGPSAPATIQNIASTEERQRYNDLLNFLGNNPQNLGLGAPTYQPYQVNKEDVAKEIAQREQTFNQQVKAGDTQVKNLMGQAGNSLPSYMQQFLTKEPSLQNMTEALQTFEQKQSSTPTGQQFLNFLNGSSPPSEWGWNNEIANNYRNQYAWYPALKNQLSNLTQGSYTRVVNPNKGSALLAPSYIQTKLGGV